ncbi:MAG: ADOP family duplicated permease, partial [Ramlibacter sp.]
GVAPAGFDGTDIPAKVALWMPMTMYKEAMPNAPPGLLDNAQFTGFDAIGRLEPGVEPAQAQAAVEASHRQFEQDNPPPANQGPPNPGRALKLVPVRGIFGPLRSMAAMPSKLLAAAVLAVLLIACANVANLLLARAATRSKEIAVRLALGATRRRMVQQLLTESLLLALLGAGGGLLLAYWLDQLLTAFKPPFPPPHTFSLDLTLDGPALGFALLLAVVTSVGFGLIPALQASKRDVVPALRDEGGAARPRRGFNLRDALVVAQVALSLLLLVGAGLFLRSVQRAQGFDLGFKPDHVLTVSFNLGSQGYNETRGKEFLGRIAERLERLPDVKAVSVADFLPLGFMGRGTQLTPEGRDLPSRERPTAGDFAVGLRYFETLGTPLLRGRDFTVQDTEAAPAVAIINQGLAGRLWPDFKDIGEALGQRIHLGGPEDPLCEVIGVAADTKNSQFSPLDGPAPPTLYRPFAQSYSPSASLVVRTGGDPRSLIPAVRREVVALDRNLPPQELQPLTENIALALWPARTGASFLSMFGVLGLVLAALGMYGVMSYAVAWRTHEIGVRRAVGAQGSDVLRLVVGHGMLLALVGAGIGLAAAWALTRLLANQLYGVSATDPLTFAGASLFLIAVALVACYLPARRATRVDPVAALHRD